MKVILKVTENHIPQTDDVGIRLNILLLKHESEDKYKPTEELSIGWKKDHALDIENVIAMFRQLADKIEQHGP